MSLHINRFVDRIKAAESRGTRDFMMTLKEAQDLHADITKLLLALHTIQNNTESRSDTKDSVEITGGTF